MELRHLRYFSVLAEELHYGRAARRLAITQPPLSVNIQALEAEVGAPLFTRNSRGVALTAAGLALLPLARELLAQAATAPQVVRDAAQGLGARLRIGFAGTMLYRGLPAMLRRLERDARVRLELVELSSSDQLVELTRGRLDAGFVHTTRVPAEFEQLQVARQPFVVCLPAGHALARRRRVALADLRGAPLALVSREVSSDYHERILAACADAGWVPDTRHDLRHWLSVVSLVAQGLGVALVPEALRQSAMAGAVFVSLAATAGQAVPMYDTWCLWRPRPAQPALDAFVQAVRDVVAAR